jgi:hypothetical protein
MKATKGSVWLAGPIINKRAAGTRDACFAANEPLLAALLQSHQVRRDPDCWFVDGRLGQLWEYGIGTIGFTVGNGTMIQKAIQAGFVPTHRGNGEANFGQIAWTPEILNKLTKLLRLRRRRLVSSCGKNALHKPPLRPGGIL